MKTKKDLENEIEHLKTKMELREENYRYGMEILKTKSSKTRNTYLKNLKFCKLLGVLNVILLCSTVYFIIY